MTDWPPALEVSLQLAVPMWIMEMRDWEFELRAQAAKECANAVAAHGDDLLFGGKHCAETFNRLAQGLACCAYQPGGVKFMDTHWHVDAEPDPPGGFTVAFLEHLKSVGVRA